MAEKYVLTLDKDQALMVRDACELYARIQIGQFNIIPEYTLDFTKDDACTRRDNAEAALELAAKIIFGTNGQGLLNVSHNEYHHRAWNIYQVVRNKIAWHDNPEGGTSVCFSKPMSLDGSPLPMCEVIDDIHE